MPSNSVSFQCSMCPSRLEDCADTSIHECRRATPTAPGSCWRCSRAQCIVVCVRYTDEEGMAGALAAADNRIRAYWVIACACPCFRCRGCLENNCRGASSTNNAPPPPFLPCVPSISLDCLALSLNTPADLRLSCYWRALGIAHAVELHSSEIDAKYLAHYLAAWGGSSSPRPCKVQAIRVS